MLSSPVACAAIAPVVLGGAAAAVLVPDVLGARRPAADDRRRGLAAAGGGRPPLAGATLARVAAGAARRRLALGVVAAAGAAAVGGGCVGQRRPAADGGGAPSRPDVLSANVFTGRADTGVLAALIERETAGPRGAARGRLRLPRQARPARGRHGLPRLGGHAPRGAGHPGRGAPRRSAGRGPAGPGRIRAALPPPAGQRGILGARELLAVHTTAPRNTPSRRALAARPGPRRALDAPDAGARSWPATSTRRSTTGRCGPPWAAVSRGARASTGSWAPSRRRCRGGSASRSTTCSSRRARRPSLRRARPRRDRPPGRRRPGASARPTRRRFRRRRAAGPRAPPTRPRLSTTAVRSTSGGAQSGVADTSVGEITCWLPRPARRRRDRPCADPVLSARERARDTPVVRGPDARDRPARRPRRRRAQAREGAAPPGRPGVGLRAAVVDGEPRGCAPAGRDARSAGGERGGARGSW